jgi:Big-like domain-containing protein/HYDIN/CFA65/VesB family protein/centrosomal CEP192-like protein
VPADDPIPPGVPDPPPDGVARPAAADATEPMLESGFRVTAVQPTHGSDAAAAGDPVTVWFSEPCDERSVSPQAFLLYRQGMDVPIPAAIAYDPATASAALRADSGLEKGAAYTAVVRGGPDGVVSAAAGELPADVSWSFTTRKGPSRWLLVAAVVAVLAVVGVVVGLLVTRGDDSPTVTPEAIDFGDQALGARSASRDVEVTNHARDTLVIADVSFAGADPADFVRAGARTCTTGASLEKDASCQLGVSFAPSTQGERSATLFIGLQGGSSLSVALSGTGTGKAVAVGGTDQLSFGSVTVGAPAVTRQTTVTNQGNAPLTVDKVSVTGADPADYTIAKGTTCNAGTPVPPAGRCEVAVAFAPRETGERNATLEVAHGGTGSPLDVALAGTGVGSVDATIAPAQKDFGSADVGATTPLATFTVENVGTADLPLTSIALKGASPRSFVISGAGTCAGGATVKPGASCTVTVVFAPVAPGAVSATLSVVAGGTERSSSLTGQGVAPAGSSTGSTP